MARPRTPTKVLELRGAFDKDPQRTRTDPDLTGPLGDPPKTFTEDEREIWNELQAMAPAAVLEKADRWLVEITCRTMHVFRRSGPNGMTAAQLNLLVSCLSRMGMTPADRSKVGVQTPKEDKAQDKLAEFASQSRIRIPN